MQSSKLSVLGSGVLLALILVGCAAEGTKSASSLPKQAAELFEEYKTKPHYRALATTRDFGSRGWATNAAWDQLSAELAVEDAMQRCRRAKFDTLYECRLYAVGDTIVAGMTEEQIARVISENVLANRPTGLTAKAAEAFLDYKTKSHYRAFAITPRTGTGKWASGRAWGQLEVDRAVSRAMEECQKGREKYGAENECQIYAVGNVIVHGMSDDDLEAAIKIYKNDVASDRAGRSTSASDSVICNFAITTKDGTVSWESRADWLGYVNEAKRRNLTPDQCAELLGR